MGYKCPFCHKDFGKNRNLFFEHAKKCDNEQIIPELLEMENKKLKVINKMFNDVVRMI